MIGNVFRNYAKSLGIELPIDPAEAAKSIPHNREMVIARMMKNWPGDIGVILDFKEYLGVPKELNALDRLIFLDGFLGLLYRFVRGLPSSLHRSHRWTMLFGSSKWERWSLHSIPDGA